jgi:hypothetical protein
MSNELSAQKLLPPEIGLTLLGFEKSEARLARPCRGPHSIGVPFVRNAVDRSPQCYWRQLQDLPDQGVTSRTAFPLRYQPIPRPLSQISFLSNQRWHVDGAGKWDRILALCRQERYPNRRGAKQNCDSERPAKTAGRSSRFRPKASAPRLHQRNGLDFDLAQAEGV